MFKPNRNFGPELLRQREFRRALREQAEVVAEHAETFADQAGAPWMPRSGSGTNRTMVVDDDGETVRVVNTDHAGHLMEWGGEHNPAHAPLRRGVQAAGLRLDEHPQE